MYAPLTMTDDSMESRLTMLRLINGFQGSQAIHTLVQMSIPDLLADGTQTSDDLAAKTGAQPVISCDLAWTHGPIAPSTLMNRQPSTAPW